MGSYIHKNLISNEHVLIQAKYHWIIFFSLRGLFTLFLSPAIERWLSEFIITNRRIIMKTGFIAVRTFEMNLSKIESVTVNQTITGRIFNYGSITIIGSGGTRETFNNIPQPLMFRRTFQENC